MTQAGVGVVLLERDIPIHTDNSVHLTCVQHYHEVFDLIPDCKFISPLVLITAAHVRDGIHALYTEQMFICYELCIGDRLWLSLHTIVLHR